LKVIVTGVTKVGGSETEENGNGAAVAAFVFEKVHSMFWTHLKGVKSGDVSYGDKSKPTAST
jgi:hypothetical protein